MNLMLLYAPYKTRSKTPTNENLLGTSAWQRSSPTSNNPKLISLSFHGLDTDAKLLRCHATLKDFRCGLGHSLWVFRSALRRNLQLVPSPSKPRRFDKRGGMSTNGVRKCSNCNHQVMSIGLAEEVQPAPYVTSRSKLPPTSRLNSPQPSASSLDVSRPSKTTPWLAAGS
ncbi:hypothetical protein P153DRAFT_203515 [Dothidotthia symphoricarpi CBS 119687]|uniref:Uncharacterized protein n=1 Tax=Dothidotthia symphoricarpi CBS 119687 TaxID=1392245 RepID=A0A6A6AFF3_9PLEO|nr:uncharacterized protein P153DRAFT_203515 [Dothidotthia symphoricarpi CBS 119687]KAF2130702.1 hypothetical protein P153DRAFT_203515 [Dothidotthia symphoricarpi CBS 119687]